MALGVVRHLDTLNNPGTANINAGTNATVYVENRLAVVIGDVCDSHGDAGAATMDEGSAIVFARKAIGGFSAVCRIGDGATCAHAALTGSAIVLAN